MGVSLPPQVSNILATLEGAGYEAFVVGGCVRDIIRGTQPTDWDITTSATPAQAKALFLRTVDTGIKHGTITVLFDGQHFEVTTYRIDGKYLDNRRPQAVTFASNIEDDLSRRDFTMNAIAYNPRTGFMDPHGGIADINARIIRSVGDAHLRFGEDALRMLRAVRFCGTTGFTIHPNIICAARALAGNLAYISPERVREELVKLVMSKNVAALDHLLDTGLLSHVLQGYSFGGDIANIISWLAAAPPHEAMRMAILLHWAQNDSEQMLRSMRFPLKFVREVTQYIKMLPTPIENNRYAIKKALRSTTQGMFANLISLKSIIYPQDNLADIAATAADIAQSGECINLHMLAINGNDIIATGITDGAQVGEKLEMLLDLVLQNPNMNTREQLLHYSSCPQN